MQRSVNRETTNVGAVITGRQIIELPFTSRDALDLVLTLPGTASPGRPRSSSVNGLPKGALNISLDGINVQDNTLRSSDGFFTYIRPRIDAIEEAQVSTGTPGAEASAGGAIHIRFVTKSGTNDYRGGVWWYHRQPVLNANYFFNNLNGLPRDPVRLQQWGFKVGGPVTPWLKDRVFFFFSYDEYRLPEAASRTRNILSADAQNGIFRYPGGPAGGVNLLALAASRCPSTTSCPGTIDPTIGKILADIRSATSKGALKASSDPNFEQFTFGNTGGQIRRFPTVRFDANITSKHHIEAIYNYQDFAGQADFLNGADPQFPAPIPQIRGSQGSDRFSFSTALRSQFSSKVVNEARYGLTGGTVLFFPELGAPSFAEFGGIAPRFATNLANVIGNSALSNPYSRSDPSRRNAPIQQFTDNLSWSHGAHNFNFGGSFSASQSWQQSVGTAVVPLVDFNAPSADPVSTIFSSSTLPGADPTQIARARSIYALLIGRVSAVNFSAAIDEEKKSYSVTDPFAIQRNSAKSFGFYYQDYFKVRPNLNLNYGVRWEAALAPKHTNSVYTRPTFEGLFGVSGSGGLFKPGTTGILPTFLTPVNEKTKPFNDDLNNLAPSVGIAWTPQFKGSLLKHIFGGADQTVVRAAYAISYVTGGFGDYTGIFNQNSGLFRNISLLAGRDFPSGSLLLRNGLPQFTAPANPVFPAPTQIGVSIADFDPNLRTPYVQSWTFSIQREITRNTALEFRYLGNHSVALTRTFNLNEVNIFENGFLNDFIAAQKNLQIFRSANPNCGTPGNPACNFRNAGLAGQVAIPIFEKFFGSLTSANFANATFIEFLNQGQAGALANSLGNSVANSAFQTNRVAAGLPANLFIANPSVLGANANLQTNAGDSTYNSLQIELRRRFASGLSVSGSYVWSHALTDTGFFVQPHSLRDLGDLKGPSPYDIRHAFKVSYIYELPFGAGQRFDYRGPGGIIGGIIGGWQTDGIIRWQSGRQFVLTSGRNTVNQFESRVVLVGMSAKELQDAVKIRKDPQASTRGTVLWLPDDIIENTKKAFGLLPGAPTGRYIAPPTTPGKFGSFIYLGGPGFFRADLSLVKKTRITERTNLEFRTEFLNAFNNINFYVGGSAAVENASIGANSLTFGQTGEAYRDLSTTNDPGGRLIQFVLRFNF
jgi:hypothetical protein